MKSAKLLPLSHWVAFLVVASYPLYSGESTRFLPWITVTAGLALLGCAHHLVGRFLPAADVGWLGFGLLGLDAALVSMFIYYGGGISSPLFPLLFLLAATASFYDRWTKALSLAAAMSACYLAACLLRGFELSSQGSSLLVNIAILIGSSVLLSYLSELDRKEHGRTERIEALYRLSSDLMEKVDLEDILQHLLSFAASFLGTDVNAGRLLDRTSGKTLREGSVTAKGGGLEEALAASEEILAAVEREKRPLLINDIAADHRFASLARSGRELRSALAAPIMVGGEAVGAFSFACIRPRVFTPDDLRMLVTISNLTASVIARAELYQIVISRSEVIVESMSSGLLVTDASGRVVLANQAARDLLGVERISRDTFLRELLEESLLDTQSLWEMLEESHAYGGEQSQGRLEMRLRGTPERILSVRVSAITAGYEPNSGSVVILEDITERVKVDEIRDDLMLLIARRVEEQTALYEVGRSLVDEVDTRNLLEFLLSKAVDLVDAQIGALSLREEDGLYRIKVVHGLDARNVGLSFLEGEYLAGEVLAGRKGIRRAEMRPAEAVPWGGGIHFPLSYLAAPITWQGEITGVIEVASHARRSFGEDDLRLLNLFVNQAAIALENSNLYRLITEDQRRTEAMLHSINDGVIAVNNDAKVILVNAAAERILRLPPFSSPGERHVKEVIHHPDLVNIFLRSLKSGEDIEQEIFLGAPDRKVLEVKTSRIETGPGERVGIIAIIRDVTALRELEQAKSDFVSTVSHELRTPLTSIKAYTATLRRRDVDFDEDTRREFLRIVEEETDRLARLISELLDISRIESGRMELKRRDLDLHKLAEIVVEKIRSQTDKHDITLSAPQEELMVYVDPDKIEQVLVNLLENAVKYSPAGGEISAVIERRHRVVEFRVSDQGVGIPAEHLPLIFDKFHRVDNRATREIYGTGLGLYVSKSIVEAHGGTIWAESEPGVGSTFHFTLPLAGKSGGDDRVVGSSARVGQTAGGEER